LSEKLIASDMLLSELLDGFSGRLANGEKLHSGILVWNSDKSSNKMQFANLDEMLEEAKASGDKLVVEAIAYAEENAEGGALGVMEQSVIGRLGLTDADTYVVFRPGYATGKKFHTRIELEEMTHESMEAYKHKRIEIFFMDSVCPERGKTALVSVVHREMDRTYFSNPMTMQGFMEYIKKNGLAADE
jgi:hypothetical protein